MCSAGFAERARRLDLCRPTFRDAPGLTVSGGRHPVVEQVNDTPFVANDLVMDEQRRILMSPAPTWGQSTFMRQSALIVLMAYAGCFVPAKVGRTRPVRPDISRIGASDDLAGGRSTFMVRCMETANILHNASPRSLVLMDEIGRGTSAFDGLSLAWACAVELATQDPRLHPVRDPLLRTHLPGRYPGIVNVHLDAVDMGRHRVPACAARRPANQSYGLQVAALAGVPRKGDRTRDDACANSQAATPRAGRIEPAVAVRPPRSGQPAALPTACTRAAPPSTPTTDAAPGARCPLPCVLWTLELVRDKR